MFKYENDNEKIGAYIKKMIDKKYSSQRQFCRAYLIASGIDANDEELRKLSNRLSQIIKGKKAIQIYDLPYFTDLLGVSCEDLLSCGKSFVPNSGHITNYEVAFSKEPKVWEAYCRRPDKLILNPDEYNKTIIDYAIEFKNYAFIKYLMDQGDIWFVDDSEHDCQDRVLGFGAGTNIKRREIGSIDVALDIELRYHCEERGLRQSVIALAMVNKDFDILSSLRAREIPPLYQLCTCGYRLLTHCCDYYNEDVIDEIVRSDEALLAYFSDEFQIKNPQKTENTFIYPFLNKVIEKLVENKSKYAEAVIRKAIKHNKNVFSTLSEIINDAAQHIRDNYPEWKEYSADNCKEESMRYFYFFEEDGFVAYSFAKSRQDHSKFCANVIHTDATSNDLLISTLLEELNESFDVVQNIGPTVCTEEEKNSNIKKSI